MIRTCAQSQPCEVPTGTSMTSAPDGCKLTGYVTSGGDANVSLAGREAVVEPSWQRLGGPMLIELNAAIDERLAKVQTLLVQRPAPFLGACTSNCAPVPGGSFAGREQSHRGALEPPPR
jgi:hypothetical protein